MYISVAEYARQHNTSTKQVYDLIHTGKLPYKKLKDKLHIWLEDTEGNTEDQEVNRNEFAGGEQQQKLRLDNELKKQKLRNLQQDTLIKKQKQVHYKQMCRQQYCEGVFQCFTESFGKLKSSLIELKLNKEQNAKIKRIIGECLKEFQSQLKKYLQQKDKEELKNNEAQETE